MLRLHSNLAGTKGPEDAAYHVVEFADYLCGHCAEASKELKHWLPEQPDVKLSFKVFPLSGQCNPGLPKNDPPNLASCVAAVYADCAGQQGRFWEVNSDLYVNQGALRQVGYDPTELFVDPKLRFPMLKVVKTLVRKKLGFRYLMDVIGTDPSIVRGSHGRLFEDPEAGPVYVSSSRDREADVVDATSIRDRILALLAGASR